MSSAGGSGGGSGDEIINTLADSILKTNSTIQNKNSPKNNFRNSKVQNEEEINPEKKYNLKVIDLKKKLQDQILFNHNDKKIPPQSKNITTINKTSKGIYIFLNYRKI